LTLTMDQDMETIYKSFSIFKENIHGSPKNMIANLNKLCCFKACIASLKFYPYLYRKEKAVETFSRNNSHRIVMPIFTLYLYL